MEEKGNRKNADSIKKGKEMNDVYDRIAKKMDKMSKSQRKIAEYILNNKDSVAFMNVSKLAKEADVSEASIIRFATFMEYKGYPQLQKELQEKTREHLSMKERLTNSYTEYNDDDAGIAKIFNDDADRIQKTLSGLDFQTFHTVMEKIINARRIFIVAGRSAAALGTFFYYYLNIVMGNVELITSFNGDEEIMHNVNEEDVVIAITFKMYTRKTVELLAYAFEKNAITVSITDFMTSPVIKNSKYYFLTEAQLNTYLDSFVAPLSLINAILTYLGKYKNKELEERLTSLEAMWNEFDVFQ